MHSSQQAEFQLQSQLPKGSRPQPTLQSKKPLKEPRSRRFEAADWFLRHAPKASEWRKRQMEMGLETVEHYQQAIRAFTHYTPSIVKRGSHKEGMRAEYAPEQLADTNFFTNTTLQRSLATFQVLVLLSYCQVLKKRGVSYQVVDYIIEHITQKETDRRRLLQSALWVNKIIVTLTSHGWTINRATELFFISTFPYHR